MKRALAAALVLLLPALAACTTAEPPGAAEPSFYTDLASPQAQIDPQMALSMLNGYRANNGVAPLALDPQLTAIAQAYADRMAAADDHGHNLDGRSDLATRLQQGGFAFDAAGENIAAGYRTLAEAFSGWRESPDHNRGMLDGEMTLMGIATAYNPNSRYRVFWCAIFARPKSPEPIVAIPSLPGATTFQLVTGQ
jgi:uncharacterized protein YkwD